MIDRREGFGDLSKAAENDLIVELGRDGAEVFVSVRALGSRDISGDLRGDGTCMEGIASIP